MSHDFRTVAKILLVTKHIITESSTTEELESLCERVSNMVVDDVLDELCQFSDDCMVKNVVVASYRKSSDNRCVCSIRDFDKLLQYMRDAIKNVQVNDEHSERLVNNMLESLQEYSSEYVCPHHVMADGRVVVQCSNSQQLFLPHPTTGYMVPYHVVSDSGIDVSIFSGHIVTSGKNYMQLGYPTSTGTNYNVLDVVLLADSEFWTSLGTRLTLPKGTRMILPCHCRLGVHTNTSVRFIGSNGIYHTTNYLYVRTTSTADYVRI